MSEHDGNPADPHSSLLGGLAVVPRRVDARDVLDPNARVQRAFDARPIGCFRRCGPNAWDDYELVPAAEDTTSVLPGLEIQLEVTGAVFRMRRAGEVDVLEWLPSAEERKSCRDAASSRQLFFETYLKAYASPPARGLAALIAKKLKEGE